MNTKNVHQLLLAALLLLPACGSNDEPKKQSVADLEVRTASMDQLYVPPRPYYNALLIEKFKFLSNLAKKNEAPTLYVKFDGATIEKGFAAGQSFIVCSDEANVPPATFSAGEQEQIIEKVQGYFDDAGVNLTVTSSAPSVTSYTTIIVGGTMADLGCTADENAFGAAPFDEGNANKEDIAFAFTGVSEQLSPNMVAATIAHEAGHAMGLNHVNEAESIMYRAASSDSAGFIAGTLGSGEGQDQPALLKKACNQGDEPANNLASKISKLPKLSGKLANLPGLEQIAGFATVLLGLATGNVLNIAALIPLIDSIFPGGLDGLLGKVSDLPGLDKIGGLTGLQDLISIVGLLNGAALDPTKLSGLIKLIPGKAGDIAASLLAALANPNAGGLDKLLDLFDKVVGVGGIANIFAMLQDLLDGFGLPLTASKAQAIPMKELPDFDTLLDLGQYKDVGSLFAGLEAHAEVVNANFDGYTRDTMLTLLKVAYAQAYAKLK
jgi:hypothetical protein